MFTSLQQLSNFTAYFHHKRIKDHLEIFGIFRTQPAPSSRVASFVQYTWFLKLYPFIAAKTEANAVNGAKISGSIWAKHLVDKFKLFNFSGKFLAGLQKHWKNISLESSSAKNYTGGGVLRLFCQADPVAPTNNFLWMIDIEKDLSLAPSLSPSQWLILLQISNNRFQVIKSCFRKKWNIISSAYFQVVRSIS